MQFSKGIIGPYVFRDDDRRTTTVTVESYLEMLQKFFLPVLRNNASVENSYFSKPMVIFFGVVHKGRPHKTAKN